MSFSDVYENRFRDVLAPAIQSVIYRGTKLSPIRVDLSKSGDSILTEIVDGIAHSTLVLADVSVLGRDSKSGKPYRNGNVMYEVGIALACRQPAEVLLLRDDNDPFLFDVSTVPHKQIDFSEPTVARSLIAVEIEARLSEIQNIYDARLQIAVATMTAHERALLDVFSKFDMTHKFGLPTSNIHLISAIPRLLDKQLLRTVSISADGHAMFAWTTLGRAIADNISTSMPRDAPRPMPPKQEPSGSEPSEGAT